MLRLSLQGEVDVVQFGVHVRNQDMLCADDTLTSLSHSQRVGKYLERRKETFKALFHEVYLKTELMKPTENFQHHFHMSIKLSRMC